MIKENYEEELKDVETCYETGLKEISLKMRHLLPSLLVEMEQFVVLHKSREEIVEKLDTLRAKMGKEDCESGDECEYCGDEHHE